jgi:signal transduction histidine kinase/DNA-binding CsgD family transcriptional regulator
MSEASALADRDEMRRLAEKLIVWEEDERHRLAIELESNFTQRLTNLVTDASRLEKELRQSDPKIAFKIRAIQKKLLQISADAHRLSERLHPSVLEEKGLVKALQEECDRFSKLRRINVSFITQNAPEEVPGYVALSLYRIVQESLSNVARHARARGALVSLTGNEGLLCLLIKDEGVGFDPISIQTRKGSGLAGIEERTRLIGGRYTVKSAPGKGTSVVIEVPVPHREPVVSIQARPKLTQRQVDILRLLAQGRLAKEIAVRLSISAKTVEFHKYRIMGVLGVKTVADLIRFAVRHGVVPL